MPSWNPIPGGFEELWSLQKQKIYRAGRFWCLQNHLMRKPRARAVSRRPAFYFVNESFFPTQPYGAGERVFYSRTGHIDLAHWRQSSKLSSSGRIARNTAGEKARERERARGPTHWEGNRFHVPSTFCFVFPPRFGKPKHWFVGLCRCYEVLNS